MVGWRQAVALAMTGEEIEALTALSRSRTEPAGRVRGQRMLLGYREKPSFFAVGRRLGVHHQTVERCVERAMAYGALAALDDRPRSGQGADDHAGGQGLVGIFGLRQGQGARLSARTVDDTAFGPIMRASVDRRPGHALSRQAGSRHRVQASRSRGNQAAQGALLSGTAVTLSSSRRWRKFCASIARSRS